MRQTALLLRQKAYLALKMYTRNKVTIYIFMVERQKRFLENYMDSFVNQKLDNWIYYSKSTRCWTDICGLHFFKQKIYQSL